MSIVPILIIPLFIFIILPMIAGIVLLIVFSVRKSKRKNSPEPVRKPVIEAYTSPEPVIEHSPEKRSLAEVLKEQRIRCGMTQEFVAEQLQVSRQAVSKWENGTSDPSTGNLIALAQLYGISPGDLLRDIQK